MSKEYELTTSAETVVLTAEELIEYIRDDLLVEGDKIEVIQSSHEEDYE